jgi:hypothetical protein
MSGNASWAIVCGGEICGIELTFWIGLTGQEPIHDSHEGTNKHNTATAAVPGAVPPAVNPDVSCGRGLALLALAENAMIAWKFPWNRKN